jgi:F-type H+-transporting ATPase subunit epsilon
VRLKVLLPTKVAFEQDVTKIVAEAVDGAFCLLPRHVDFVAPLVPGILSYETERGREAFLAVDEGMLVKRDREVLVSTRNAVHSRDLERLEATVENVFRTLDEDERKARSAAAKLEASFVQRFLDLQDHEPA